MGPFIIRAVETEITAEAAPFRSAFAQCPAFVLDDVMDPALLQQVLAQAAATNYVHDDVKGLGTREIEEPQRVGAMLRLLLSRSALLTWLEQATGAVPLRAIAGRLAQTRTRAEDGLDWHDDRIDLRRRLGLILNLSAEPFEGGAFELRRKGEPAPFFSYHYTRPGTLMVFAVRPDIEHRVAPVLSGGPRRVFAGWAMTEPEHAGDPLVRRI